VLAWTAEDRELFQLQSDLAKLYGSEATFYTFFELPNGEKSTFKEINKQFKKLSKKYHPDKSRDVSKKRATKRYEKLNLIANILKSDKKKRYDYFLQHGFPKYSSSSANWIYSKFKPGLVFTMIFLVVLATIVHFIALKIQRSQDRKRIETLIAEVKVFAQKQVPNGEFDTQQRKIRIDRLGKTFLVRIDGVFLCNDDDDTQLERISGDDIQDPTWRDVLIVRWTVGLWNNVLGSMYYIDLSPPVVEHKEVSFQGKKQKKKKVPTGEKKVLPNGKVIYSKKKN
jgi:hypothetical protein